MKINEFLSKTTGIKRKIIIQSLNWKHGNEFN